MFVLLIDAEFQNTVNYQVVAIGIASVIAQNERPTWGSNPRPSD